MKSTIQGQACSERVFSTAWGGLYMSRPDSRPDPIGGSEPVSGTRDSGLGLTTGFFFFFFFKTELIPVGMAHILKQNPNIIYKSKNYHRSGVHQILDTYN